MEQKESTDFKDFESTDAKATLLWPLASSMLKKKKKK